jgi:hypothetical protein
MARALAKQEFRPKKLATYPLAAKVDSCENPTTIWLWTFEATVSLEVSDYAFGSTYQQ